MLSFVSFVLCTIMNKHMMTDRKNSSTIDRLIKLFRVFIAIGIVFLSCFLTMVKRFGELKTILTSVLSDKTIEIIRAIMQSVLGTNSVYIALQMLISYSFVFLSTISVAFLALSAFKFLLFAVKSFLFRLTENRSKEIFFTRRSLNSAYLFYSKLNI